MAALALLATTGCGSGVPAPWHDARAQSLRTRGEFKAAASRARTYAESLQAVRAPRWRLLSAQADAEALAALAAAPGALHDSLLRTEAIMPDTVSDLSQWAALTPRLEQQLALRKAVLGSHHPDVAATLTALARADREQGSAGGARRLDALALDIRRRRYGRAHPDIAESLDRLARDDKNAGLRFPQALEESQQAVDMLQALGLGGTPLGATVLLTRANLFRIGNQPDRALRDLEQVVRIRRRCEGSRGRGLAEALCDQAVLAQFMHRDALAAERAGESRRMLEALGEPPTALMSLAINVEGVSLLKTGRAREAVGVLERSAAVQEARWRRARKDVGRTHRSALVAHSDQAWAMLECGDTAAALPVLDRAYSRPLLEASLERSPALGTDPWRDLLARIDRVLPESTAVVGWLTAPAQGVHDMPVWSFVLRRGEPPHAVRWVPGHARQSHKASQRAWALQNQLRAAAAWPVPPPVTPALDTLLVSGYDNHIAPIEPWLRGVREIVVLGTDAHQGVPIEMLQPRAGQALLERFAVTYTPSLLLWLRAHESARATRPRAQWRALLVGDPASRDGLAGGPPESARELQALHALWPEAEVLRGEAASEGTMRRRSESGQLATLDYLHIAVHARNSDSFVEDAGLVFAEGVARADDPAAADSLDGRVTPDEIARWRFGSPLVTLAACRTAGPYPTRTDGYAGLGQCLLQAGARNVVVNLWSSDDRATRLLVTRFVAELRASPGAPCSAAEALRRAKVALRDWRDPAGRQPYRHPCHWASAVLLGAGD